MPPCLRGLYVAALIVATLGTSIGAQSDPKSQSDRVAARIRALQAESDRLAAQARTVFGELRRLEIDREIKQAELAKTQTALARVTADRDRVEKRLKALEATRIAQTPGIKERLVELSKHGRAGYVQLLLASNDVRAIGRMARGVAAVAEIDRVRLETHRRTLAAERDALNELDQKHDEVEALQKDAARARAAVEAAVAARNRMIEDLDQRRDLAAQYVAELQQAQAAARSARWRPRRRGSVGRGAADSALQGRSAMAGRPVKSPRDSGAQTAGRFGTSIVRNGIEVSAAEGTAATAVHEGTVAFAAPFSGFGTLVIVDHGGSAFTLYGHLLDACRQTLGPTSAAARRLATSACRRPAEPPCISRSASTGAR